MGWIIEKKVRKSRENYKSGYIQRFLSSLDSDILFGKYSLADFQFRFSNAQLSFSPVMAMTFLELLFANSSMYSMIFLDMPCFLQFSATITDQSSMYSG